MEKYLEYFYEISSIPHGSGNTALISDYLKNFAIDHGYYFRQDEMGNVVIKRPAYPGYEEREPVILQGHMDMVAVKDNDTDKDMKAEGLDLFIDGDYLRAKGTSLGGDDGIAVAYILTILDGDYPSPEIQAIITVDEETGMLGATAFEPTEITAKRMINIDHEEEDSFIAGCAGGVRVNITMPVEKEILHGKVFDIKASGLKGGHSGVDINKGRGNAVKILDDELCKLHEKIPFRIIEFNGGVADNVIPNEAVAKIMLTDENNNSIFEKEITKLNGMDFYFGNETNYDMGMISVTTKNEDEMIVLSEKSTEDILSLIGKLPSGVIAYSEANPEFVETSVNLGAVRSNEDDILITLLPRSSEDMAKNSLVMDFIKAAREFNASYELIGDYPGWKYQSDSSLRNTMISVYEEMNGKKPEVMVIHAGLECGIFCGKIEGLDVVAFGPEIEDIHSVNERLSLASAKRMFDFLAEVLKRL